jgi:putative transposase
LIRKHQGYGDTFFIDEVFVKINGKQHYLWRAVDQYADNRAEQSHEATRVRERGMRRFKSIRQAQRFVTAHAAVANLFNLGRHLIRARHYCDLRKGAFGEWNRAVA